MHRVIGNVVCALPPKVRGINLFRYLRKTKQNVPTCFNSNFGAVLDLQKNYKENTESSHKLRTQSLPLKDPY